MAAANWKIVLEQGTAWDVVLTLSDADGVIDLTGYTARMQVRESRDSPEPLLELTTENGGIAITGPTGKVALSIADDESSAWTWRYGVYDLELVSPSGAPDRLLKGEFEVDPEITR